jgi:hypothetical protein
VAGVAWAKPLEQEGEMKRWRSRRAAVTLTTLLAGMSLVGSTLVVPPAMGAEPPLCPEAMPVDNLQAGTMGTGYTVSKGTEPEPFDAEILGVYPDAILPGRDLVIAEVHSPAIDKVGGVWFGMSGSPVFVDDGGTQKLVGAVAWGSSFGPSHIIGLTAGQDMLDLLDYPNSSTGRSASTATPKRIQLTAPMKQAIGRATGESSAEVASSFTVLKTPASVSGVGGARLKELQRKLNRRGLNVRLYPGASASADDVADPAELKPGSNFAAALSYGDVTFAGIGTTTFVCDGMAVAFGHPFDFEGATQLGANAASAITIWEDPVFSPFKLATVGGSVGTVDQDRFAGIRADFGETIDTIPITSNTFAENTSRTQIGRTDVVNSEYATYLSPEHEYLNVISAMDEFSEGSAEMAWTITGTRADGTPWELTRVNMASDRYGIPYEVAHEHSHMIYTLVNQNFEEVELTSVDWTQVTVRDVMRHYRLGKVLVSTDGEHFRRERRVRVRPGTRLLLQAYLNPLDEGPQQVVDLSVRVPRGTRRSGELEIFGGPGHHIGLVRGGDSFDELLAKMAADPPQNSLGVKLRIGRSVKDRDSSLLDQVVRGNKSIFVRVRGARRGHGEVVEG